MNPDHLRAVTTNAPAAHRLAGVGACLLVLSAAACAPRMVEVQPALPPAHPEFTYPAVPDSLRRTAATPHLVRGWQLLQRDERQAAAREFATALQRDPGFYPAMAASGYVALAGDDYPQALASFDAALGRDARYLPALVGRGHALLALDRLDDATAAFEAAVATDPSLQPLHDRVEVLRVRRLQSLIETARLAAERGRTDEARAAYADAIARSPESAFLHRELAGVERRAGEREAARRHLTRAVEIDPTAPLVGTLPSPLVLDRGQVANLI